MCCWVALAFPHLVSISLVLMVVYGLVPAMLTWYVCTILAISLWMPRMACRSLSASGNVALNWSWAVMRPCVTTKMKNDHALNNL